MVLTNSDYFEGNIVRAVKWRTGENTNCSPIIHLAIGGDASSLGNNIQIYSYDTRLQTLLPIATHAQPGQVFTLAWVPGCTWPHLAVGSGCITGECVPNITVYIVLRKDTCEFELASIEKKSFNGTITSLALCTMGNITYLLAGAEVAWQTPNALDPLCGCIQTYNQELALYQSSCSVNTNSCKPTPICARTEQIKTQHATESL